MYPAKIPNPMPPLAMNHTAAAPKTRPTRTPDHPATRNAVRRFFVSPHTAASSILPPSRGNPGNAFSTAKISDSQARYPTMSETTPAVARWATQNTPGEHQRRGRSDGGDQELAERSTDVGPRLGGAAPEDERHARGPAGRACAP